MSTQAVHPGTLRIEETKPYFRCAWYSADHRFRVHSSSVGYRVLEPRRSLYSSPSFVDTFEQAQELVFSKYTGHEVAAWVAVQEEVNR